MVNLIGAIFSGFVVSHCISNGLPVWLTALNVFACLFNIMIVIHRGGL